MLLGCIGDDFTGSSDLGNVLARSGMSTVQYCGVPSGPAEREVEAGIVALKSRSIPVGDAIQRSLEALRWLRAQGCRQFLFKYCSTFDSTPEGNIGPVAEALADALDAETVLFCPAYPTLGRSVYQGHLFVGDRLLNESGMETHPLNPMTDADIRRWLARQCARPVGHLPQAVVAAGRAAIGAALADLTAEGRGFVVPDIVRDDDLIGVGAAAERHVLVTGGSGIALGLAENFRRAGLLSGEGSAWTGVSGPCAILSGSCSTATQRQVERHRAEHPSLELSSGALFGGSLTPSTVCDWIAGHSEGLPLVYSTATPEDVSAAQARYGRAALSGRIESFFRDLAPLLVRQGVTRLVVAGGETSGAVVEELDVEALSIGPEIDPGVPALRTEAGGNPLALALKSGNFGSDGFFAKAAARLGPA